MASMLGGRKNHGKHGSLECPWGCCRSLVTGKKSRTRKILRTREKRSWREDSKHG